MKILIVDDHPTNRKLLGAVLEAENHTIVQAGDGNEALQVLERDRIDLIISDILMPGMDGYRFCYEVRSKPSLAALPFIFYTSTYTSPADAELARKTGADKFLTKPASPREILTAIEDVTLRRQAPQSPMKSPDELGIMKEYSARLVAKLEEKNHELCQRTEELSQREEHLQQLSGRLLQLQDEERRRIARELHDHTAQNLAALTMNLSLLETFVSGSQTGGAEVLKETVALADKCSREIRTIAYLLHPPALDVVGLADTAEEYIEGFSRRSRIAVTLDADAKLGRFSPDTEIALFRILQESLGNVHRHSGSRTASIRLFRKTDQVVLEVKDDGRGIAAEKREDGNGPATELGVGIPGMRERMQQLGGRLDIETGDAGTLIRATAPFCPRE